MNRKELLQASLTEEKNLDTVISSTLTKDGKSLKKAKRDLEDQIEEKEEELETRLSSSTPIDKATVEITYAKLLDLKATLALYEAFEAEYLD